MRKLTTALAAIALIGAATPVVARIVSKYPIPWAPGTCITFTGYTYSFGPC